MPGTTVGVFDQTLHKTYEWLEELRDIADLRDEGQAYAVLRGVLHALRDRLTVDEAADLGAQMPMLVRGLYFEGWDPSSTPRKTRSRETFLDSISLNINPSEGVDVEQAARAVFALLTHRITSGEISDVRHMLPRDVRELWPVGG